MKRCSFCAEEIQDAAIVCRFCQRDLSTATPTPAIVEQQPPKDGQRKWVALGIVTVLALAALWALRSPSPTPTGSRRIAIAETERLLNITASKGLLLCSITNRELTPIRSCGLYVDDAEGVRWSVDSTKTIAPLETATFDWSSFTAQGQPMPAYIGRDRGVYVSCLVTDLNKRLSAAFR